MENWKRVMEEEISFPQQSWSIRKLRSTIGMDLGRDLTNLCCCRLSLMPTPDWWLSLMPTTIMYSLPDGDPCSGHSTMIGAQIVDDGHVVVPWGPWWCGGACLLMMQPGDALMPYVFTVFVDACGWIPCYMMIWRWYDDDDMKMAWWWW